MNVSRLTNHKIKMITEQLSYGAQCDNCKEPWEDSYSGITGYNDKDYMNDVLQDWDWHKTDSGLTYCDKCHNFNDEDELVIDSERTKN